MTKGCTRTLRMKDRTQVLILILYYFHYNQFNLLVNKLKSLPAIFTITIAIIAKVKYMCRETVRLIGCSVHYSQVGTYI